MMSDLEMQELSTASSSDGERSEYDIRDKEIVEALRVDDEHQVSMPHTSPKSSAHTFVRGFGLFLVVVACLAAIGIIFYGGHQEYTARKNLELELKEVEQFVQYEPKEVIFVEEEFSDATLKMTDPPPM